MADYMTTKKAASLWNISERRVSILCKDGRIFGSVKQDRTWLIPADAEKPEDNRINQVHIKRPVNLLTCRCLSVFPITVSHHRNITTSTKP